MSDNEIPVSFSAFVTSLASSALQAMGEMPDPVSRQVSVDKGLAHHSIGLLVMLEDKTSGNLTEDEATLLSTLLKELKDKYAAL